MRLQLTIQRHGLPPTQILWTVGGLRPPFMAASSSITISQLLQNVNEVIPLESDLWGLEDYIVELHGFECLHFAELIQVLREDDHVNIRPLQTDDLRARKISGRHQISSDGRHLIDGAVFGRPLLRRPDRPSIYIPPRKRRKLSFDDTNEEEDEQDQANPGQIIIHTSISDGDDESFGDSDDDKEYCPDHEETRELDDEIDDLNEDSLPQEAQSCNRNQHIGNRLLRLDSTAAGLEQRTRSQRRAAGLGIQDEGLLELVDEHGRPFPSEYHNPLLDFYDQIEGHEENYMVKKKTKKKRKKKLMLDPTGARESNHVFTRQRSARRDSSASTKSVRFVTSKSSTPATFHDLDEKVEDKLGTGNVDTLANAEEDLCDSDKENNFNKENAEPGSSDTGSSEISSLLSDADDTSSVGISESTSSSSSSSSSNSESENQDNSRQEISNDEAGITRPVTRRKSPTSASEPSKKQEDEKYYTPPGRGKKETRARNQRRRDSKKLMYLKSIGVLSPSAVAEDLKHWYEQQKVDPVRECMQGKDATAELDAKRKSLLQSIASGDIDKERNKENEQLIDQSRTGATDLQVSAVPQRKTIDNPMNVDKRDLKQSLASELFGLHPNTGVTDTISDSIENRFQDPAIASELSKRRSRLDIASSRRLLFGSFGLRAPKNKQEENEVREKLMKKANPVAIARLQSTEDTARLPLDDDSWKERIILKAVECCYEGVELSTPPFPFVQRWDPQQRIDHSKKLLTATPAGNSRKRKRNDAQYHEPSVESGEHQVATDDLALNSIESTEMSAENNVFRNDSDGYEAQIHDQLMRDVNRSYASAPGDADDTDDLPALPENLSDFKLLKSEDVVPRTIFAFKQLDMSQQTNWQPRISDYKTAEVNHVCDGGLMQITLARRDRPTQKRLYDQTTGERLYSKFEMPDFEDQEWQAEDGNLELSLADLIEPRLIRKPQDADPSFGVRQLVAESSTEAEDARILLASADGKRQKSKNTPLESTGIDEINDDLLATQDRSTTNGKPDEILLHEHSDISEDTRKDISLLIRDAGFHSDVVGVDDVDHRADLDGLPKLDMGYNNERSQSPLFNGHSSGQQNESPVRSPTLARMTPERGQGKAQMSDASSVFNWPSSSLNSYESYQSANDGAAEDRQSNKKSTRSSAGSAENITSTLAYNSGLLKSSEDIDLAQEEQSKLYPNMAIRSGKDIEVLVPLHESDDAMVGLNGSHEVAFQVSSTASSPLVEASSASRPRGGGFQSEKPSRIVSPVVRSDSESDELPSLEIVFSQKPSTKSSFETPTPGAEEGAKSLPRRLSPRRTNGAQGVSSSQPMTFKKSASPDDWPPFTNNAQLPRSSQVPVRSQIVDLTLSSDLMDPVESEYEERGTGLPDGPGWVEKRTTRASSPESKRSGKNFKRTKSTV